MDAGHYIHGRLDFDEDNIHAQCTHCNRYLHGNLGIYAEKLIALYGKDRVEKLRRRSTEIEKWSEDELKRLIEHYQKKITKLEQN